jgi:hypothetical protein
VGQEFLDEQALALELDPHDQTIMVAFDIEHRQNADEVGRREVLPDRFEAPPFRRARHGKPV